MTHVLHMAERRVTARTVFCGPTTTTVQAFTLTMTRNNWHADSRVHLRIERLGLPVRGHWSHIDADLVGGIVIDPNTGLDIPSYVVTHRTLAGIREGSVRASVTRVSGPPICTQVSWSVEDGQP